MMQRSTKPLFLSAAAVLSVILAGCTMPTAPVNNTPVPQPQNTPTEQSSAPVKSVTPDKAIAVIAPTSGNHVKGTVTFTKEESGLRIRAHLSGLTPGKHGFHVHQYGDCSASDGTSAGGHFNPQGEPHGAPADAQRHVGDFGNLVADSNGDADYNRIDKLATLSGPNSIIGRAIVIHAHADDLKSQPSGDAGSRVACGVIGVAK